MMVHFQTRIRLPTWYNPFYSILINPLVHSPKPNLPKTLKMAVTEANSKRHVCPSCSKPAKLCLCSRIRIPGLENSVRVTILQHSLEKKHPLNSARIARLGLKNVTLATVSDVNFEARFVIRLREPDSEMGSVQNGLDFDEVVENMDTQKLVFEHSDGVGLVRENVGNSEFGLFAKCPIEKNTNLIGDNGVCCLRNGLSGTRNTQNPVKDVNFIGNSGFSMSDELVLGAGDELEFEDCIVEKGTFALESPNENRDLVRQPKAHMVSAASTLNEAILDNEIAATNESECFHQDVVPIEVVQRQRGHEAPVITATIGKYGVISSLCHMWMPQAHLQKPEFDKILDSSAARDALAKGFSVKKLQERQSSGSEELEEYEEFELEVPPGSVLLFPTDCAISNDGLDALGCEVTNLIVLDGTWAKANRMYNENPWLKLLPHLKLDLNKISLYNEVRSQPKAGCLSTIESIVYALKAIGDNPEGLDDLLDVFESMVEDQRRCKDERLSKVSSV
jgi:DTW domain-containing protein YfiP